MGEKELDTEELARELFSAVSLVKILREYVDSRLDGDIGMDVAAQADAIQAKLKSALEMIP
jgi:hypothetical protein